MTQLKDTHPAVESLLIQGYRKMSPAVKFQLAMEMSQSLIQLAKTGINTRYPGISTAEMGKRLGAILWGRELSITVNQWDPEREGY
jgi:hypothetical protein